MKKIISCATAVLCTVFIISSIYSQTTIITDDPAYTTGETSAMLDVKSTGKGLLPPRMTNAERDTISNPADGLMIFNISTGCPNYYFSGSWFEWCGIAVTDIYPYPSGTVHCGDPTAVVEVLNPLTNKSWMDRNLGAVQVATSYYDSDSYGDLYQWGRFSDGHQCRTSQVHSSGLANTALPNSGNPWDGKFITSGSHPFDWLNPQDVNLWQGVNGVNNPCPDGYRIPTSAELDAERLSWAPNNNAAGAIASPLKLPAAGQRQKSDGSVHSLGSMGNYWSSTVSSNYSSMLDFDHANAWMADLTRAFGHSVRCIKD